MPQSLLGNPYAIGTPNNIRIQYTPPAAPDLSKSLARLIQSQAALLRASRPAGGGRRGMSVEDRIALEKAKAELRANADIAKYTRIVKVPKGDGTFTDEPVIARTDKEYSQQAQALVKSAQQNILNKDATLQKLRADFSSLSAPGKLKALEQLRKVDQPRLLQSTGMSAEDFAASVIAPLEAEQKKYAKEVNQGYIGKSLIDGGIMAFRSLRDAVRSIGASPAEDLAIGKATAEENQRTIESNPYLLEQQRLAREGDSGWDYALGNPLTAAVSGVARMAPLLAPVALAPATAGGSLAALGLSAVVGGAMGAGEALSRVAEDPTLSEQQKLDSIRAAQAGQGAVGAAFGALPGPAMGLRMLGRMGGRTAPGVIRSTAEHMADNAMLGAGYAIGGNAAYNAATGAEGDITAGALDSALAGAALGLPFGMRAGWRNNRARAAKAAVDANGPEPVDTTDVAPVRLTDVVAGDVETHPLYSRATVDEPLLQAPPSLVDTVMGRHTASPLYPRAPEVPSITPIPENLLSVAEKRKANRRAYRNAIADIDAYNNARTQAAWDQIEAQRKAQIREANLASPQVNPYLVPLFETTPEQRAAQNQTMFPWLMLTRPENQVRSTRTLEERGGTSVFDQPTSVAEIAEQLRDTTLNKGKLNHIIDQWRSEGVAPESIRTAMESVNGKGALSAKSWKRKLIEKSGILDEQLRATETGGRGEPAPNVGRDGSIGTPGTDETNIPASRVVPADTTPVVEPPADTNAEPSVTSSPTPEGRGDAGATPPNPREIETPAPVAREPEPGRAAATDGEPGGGQPTARPAEPDTRQRGAAPEDNAGTGGTRDAESAGGRDTVEPEYVPTETELETPPTRLEEIHDRITDIVDNIMPNDKVLAHHFTNANATYASKIQNVFTKASIMRAYGKTPPERELQVYKDLKHLGVPDMEVDKEVIAKSAETARAQGFKGSDMDYALLDTRAAMKEIENKGTTNKVC